MILSDTQIVKAVECGRIQFLPPLQDEHLRPTGVRIHLAPEIMIPRPGQVIDLFAPTAIEYDQVNLKEGPFLLGPGAFVLAAVIEKVKAWSDLLITLEGRSTIARLGLTIHNTATVLDAQPNRWFSPVLEIANHGSLSVLLRTGLPIGMLCFQELNESSSGSRFHDQYEGQMGTSPANLMGGARPNPI